MVKEKLYDIAFEQADIDWDDLLANRTWITAKRVRIPINEMQTSHIVNCIKCLKGKSIRNTVIPQGWAGNTRDKWIKVFQEELDRRKG